MARIFGIEAEHELFSVKDGSIMSTAAEARMDKLNVLFANYKSEAEMKAWQEFNPARYKLRVLDKPIKTM